ncbi:MAG TPA: carboxypeptidase regulatory-like domain-containing protein [Propionicimonas sp.]|nr:carboxypeptidase regulatory-like domain-containing protein [Propionicimonas sp.]
MARAPRPLSALNRFAIALLLTLSLVVGAGNGAAAADPVPPVDAGSGVIFGQVMGSDGDGLAEVRVSVHRWNEALGEWDLNTLTAETTDVHGDFTIAGLAPGRYTLAYAAADDRYLVTWWGRQWSWMDAEGFELAADGPAAERSITLLLGGTVSGRVTARDGSPIASAEVSFSNDGTTAVYVRTDEQGRYAFARLYPGSWSVQVSGPYGSGYLDEWWPGGDAHEAKQLAIEPGTVVRDIDIALDLPSTISGRLLDPDGQPLAGFSVQAWYQLADTGVWNPTTSRKSSSTGDFTVSGLRARPYRLEISPPWSGDPMYRSQWWPGTPDASAAGVVEVPVEGSVPLGDLTLQKLIRVRYARILGTPVVGGSLFATVLVAADVTPVRSYTWYRDGVPIPGATEDGYVVSAADAGARLTAQVELSGPSLVPQTIRLNPTEPVTDGALSPTDSLRLEGTPGGVGSNLAVFGATWNPEPSAVHFQWRRDGTDLGGETSSSYTTAAADLGKRISVRVTATRPGYQAVDQVLEAGLACYAESAVQRPTVRGVRAAGSTLTATAGTAPAQLMQGFGWQADGVALPGETKPTLTLTKALVGKAVSPIVTGTLTGCPRIIRGVDGPVVRTALAAKPRIIGTPRLKKTLRINRGTWTSNTQFSYRWYANGKAISKATNSTLRLGKSLKGKRISVGVVGEKQGYETVAMRSAATSKVR